MNEIIQNTAAGITILMVLTLPLFTLFESQKAYSSEKKIPQKMTNSILELPLVVESYDQDQNLKIEQINKEFNGLLTVFSVPSLSK